jgi:hypothetical protein
VDKGADAGRLNEIFRQDASGKGLLVFDAVSKRIDSDMAMTEAHFVWDCAVGGSDQTSPSPKCFHAIYNAVVLAKLTLLDGAALNALVSQAIGKPVAPYDANGGPGAILRGAVRNIDGNHQWQHHAPPFFRRNGSFPPEGQFREYGYALNAGQGFQLWSTVNDLRRKAFVRIFRGPIAPALESPCASEFPDVIHSSYKYRTCAASPFADATSPTGGACQSAQIDGATVVHDETGFEWAKVQVRVNNSGSRARQKRLRTEILDSQNTGGASVVAYSEATRLPLMCDGESREFTMWLDLPPLEPGRYQIVSTITDGTNVDSSQTAAQTIDVAPCREKYRIRPGETLHSIARKFEMGVWRIAGRNRIYTLDSIQAGQVICIP